MKKIKTYFFVMFSLPFVFSCKKDTVDPPAFSPVGYWTGSLIVGTTAIFINRADGTGIFYGLEGSTDTANAALKCVYTYTVKGDIFLGNNNDNAGNITRIETAHTSSTYMEGVISITNQNNIASYPFEVFKQP